ncbi:hypothetical protein ACQR0Y_07680 [Bradyrhizobium oligotrophicum]|uniref:hypothetical protein n=1 Tax=Bradyrhizobium TaxID=374 RepID=UPI002915FF12|nr:MULTISPECIES: hypothetical protein [unclassified Bradyrhizobium]
MISDKKKEESFSETDWIEDALEAVSEIAFCAVGRDGKAGGRRAGDNEMPRLIAKIGSERGAMPAFGDHWTLACAAWHRDAKKVSAS